MATLMTQAAYARWNTVLANVGSSLQVQESTWLLQHSITTTIKEILWVVTTTMGNIVRTPASITSLLPLTVHQIVHRTRIHTSLDRQTTSNPITRNRPIRSVTTPHPSSSTTPHPSNSTITLNSNTVNLSNLTIPKLILTNSVVTQQPILMYILDRTV